MADGDGGNEPMFAEDAVIRRVAAEAALVGGGLRALLLQVAEPGVAQGVQRHSDFATRPMDRLVGTLSFVQGTIFGTRAEAAALANWVRSRHRKVVGPGYDAADPGLQVWVNATLFDTSLRLYERFLPALTVAEREEFYRDYAVLATSLNTPGTAWPATYVEFESYWDSTVASLTVSAEARSVARDLLYAKTLPFYLRPAAPLNRFITTGLLPASIREQYGLEWGEVRERRFQRLLNAVGAVYRLVPGFLRRLPAKVLLVHVRRTVAKYTR